MLEFGFGCGFGLRVLTVVRVDDLSGGVRVRVRVGVGVRVNLRGGPLADVVGVVNLGREPFALVVGVGHVGAGPGAAPGGGRAQRVRHRGRRAAGPLVTPVTPVQLYSSVRAIT